MALCEGGGATTELYANTSITICNYLWVGDIHVSCKAVCAASAKPVTGASDAADARATGYGDIAVAVVRAATKASNACVVIVTDSPMCWIASQTCNECGGYSRKTVAVATIAVVNCRLDHSSLRDIDKDRRGDL